MINLENNEEGAVGQISNLSALDWQNQSGAVTAEVEQLRKQHKNDKQNIESLNTDLAAKNVEVNFVFHFMSL